MPSWLGVLKSQMNTLPFNREIISLINYSACKEINVFKRVVHSSPQTDFDPVQNGSHFHSLGIN
jgi:hypothetical protein